jgi:hypothetical protein
MTGSAQDSSFIKRLTTAKSLQQIDMKRMMMMTMINNNIRMKMVMINNNTDIEMVILMINNNAGMK